jgi:hypothetical protein
LPLFLPALLWFYIEHQLCSTLIAWYLNIVCISSFITFLYLLLQYPSTYMFYFYHGVKIKRLLQENLCRFLLWFHIGTYVSWLVSTVLANDYVTVHIPNLPQSAVNTKYIMFPNVQFLCQYKSCYCDALYCVIKFLLKLNSVLLFVIFSLLDILFTVADCLLRKFQFRFRLSCVPATIRKLFV